MEKMEDQKKKVLLIGVNSYIGRNFISYCNTCGTQLGTDDVGLDIYGISGKSGEWNKVEFDGFDSVILLSSIVHTNATEELYYEVNYKMAIDIAKKAKQSGVKQFVFMSTIAVYGEKIHLKKTSPLAPVTHYAKSKKMAEDEIAKLESEEFAVAIVRPPMVYGADCPGNFSKLVRLIHKIHFFPIYQNKRSSIYILNLCEFLRCLLVKGIGGCYIPQNSEYLCSFDVAKVMIQKGTKVLLLKGFGGIIQIGKRFSNQFRKLFGDYEFSFEDSCYDGFDYQKISTLESIEESIKAS